MCINVWDMCGIVSGKQDAQKAVLAVAFWGITVSFSLSHAKDYSQIIQDEVETMWSQHMLGGTWTVMDMVGLSGWNAARCALPTTSPGSSLHRPSDQLSFLVFSLPWCHSCTNSGSQIQGKVKFGQDLARSDSKWMLILDSLKNLHQKNRLIEHLR